MSTAGAVTRSVLTAAPGKDLIALDLASIEGRALAWLAGEETELDNYWKGLDVYVTNAAMILHKPYDSVTKEERSKIGKTSVCKAFQTKGFRNISVTVIEKSFNIS